MKDLVGKRPRLTFEKVSFSELLRKITPVTHGGFPEREPGWGQGRPNRGRSNPSRHGLQSVHLAVSFHTYCWSPPTWTEHHEGRSRICLVPCHLLLVQQREVLSEYCWMNIDHVSVLTGRGCSQRLLLEFRHHLVMEWRLQGMGWKWLCLGFNLSGCGGTGKERGGETWVTPELLVQAMREQWFHWLQGKVMTSVSNPVRC